MAYVLLAAVCLVDPIQAAAVKVSAAKATPADASVPQAVMRFRPSGTRRVWLITEVRVLPKAGHATRVSDDEVSDTGHFEALFKEAVIFERDLGVRIVPRSSKSSGQQPDYVEIRRNGTGYGVNPDGESAKSHVYVSALKLAARDDTHFGDVVTVTAAADIEYSGGTKTRKVSAQLEMQARLAEDFRAGKHVVVSKQEAGGGTPATPVEKTTPKSRARKKPDTAPD